MSGANWDVDDLIDRASAGDQSARERLLGEHRGRLRRMVAVRLDPRLSARVDPSDVVQETMVEAWQKLSDYLRRRPLPFYPWLRQLAWGRLRKLHQLHVRAQKRTVMRERDFYLPLPDDSSMQLAEGLLRARESDPGDRLGRSEALKSMLDALQRLPERDCEILVLRHLEGLSTRETAAVLGFTEGTVKVQRVRALKKLRALLGVDLEEDMP